MRPDWGTALALSALYIMGTILLGIVLLALYQITVLWHPFPAALLGVVGMWLGLAVVIRGRGKRKE